MFGIKPLVLASSTNEVLVGNRPPHGQGRDLQDHLRSGHYTHDNQLPEIDRDPN